MHTLAKLPMALGFALVTATTQAAAQDCTQEEIFERTTVISEMMLQVASGDPKKMQQISDQLMTAMDAATQSGDVTTICISLDEILAEYAGES